MSQKNDPFRPLKIRGLKLKNNLIAAPMAGLSTLPYRLLALEQGAALAFSEMISATGIVIGRNKKTSRYFYNDPAVRPFAAQLFGSEPEHISKAVEMLEDDPIDLIDINMGCPVKKVCSKGAGSALMKTPKIAASLIAAARKATGKPLTVKIRAGWDDESINCVELAKIAEDSGADAVIVHPRTRMQMFGGHSDWSLISLVKNAVSIPVIGNGDIRCRDDALRMFDETGCDAVMVGRAAVGNPWIFRQILDPEATAPTALERGAAAMRHLEHLCDVLGEQQAVLQMRTMFSWYGKGLRGVKSYRAKVCEAHKRSDIVEAIKEFFR